ncbi:PAS domain-containing protein [Ilumatobacter sp.]|uniref:PAS domain-containing protein n=1 Tax=Ilumatobacter sp. TaxID=1967498 RepID=UPI003C51DA28
MATSDASVDFASADLIDVLEADRVRFDDLSFGLVVMDRSGLVIHYNRAESALSGLDRERVVGRNFFEEVGPCTNNFLVAQRFADSEDLDETIDYVFTFRMAPTPVRLRMLARAGSDRQYLVVLRR